MKTRTVAARVIANLLNQRGSLSSLLPDAMADVPARDRALLQELCYGTCRWQPKLQCYLDVLVDKPLRNKDRDVHALLLIGLYQLSCLRVPDHAAINSTVEATQGLKKPWAKQLVNGVLRRFQREEQALAASLGHLPAFSNAHPAWLVSTFQNAWPEQLGGILSANNSHPPLTLRVNRQQMNRDDYLSLLNAQDLPAEPTPYSPDGVTLSKPVDVEQLPLFAEGAVSVQDEAAQLSAGLLELRPGFHVLDACCAPGGKTAHMLETQTQLGRMVGLDISEPRIERTRHNLQRLNLAAELVVGDAIQASSRWPPESFDRILVDAPCSATGIIRRHPDIKLLRTPEEVARLVASQHAILQAMWPLLKPGGILLYATCSILPQENTEVVSQFLREYSDARHQPLAASWGVAQPRGRQLLPQPNGHDGFYFARLEKHQRT
ncbi:MAG: 16S rRNA (cytosine(967)-C(5))-methyltransferase RsmB [Cellvibrionaceae bacterium]